MTEQAFVLTVDQDSSVPPYEQIVAGVVRARQDGRLVAGAKLPTVRALAAQLGVATNTVAKAYRQLEAEGHVRTEGRRGTTVQDLGHHDEVSRAAAMLVSTARRHRLSVDDVQGLIRSMW
ncbi:GntR family transcriptional regulator [Luteococcus sp. OSA5]|uniref:GntR family transcriptional regulator n=1 Tax=Luteococcus sp. OSA5 TaxID=3401630 RepID=UPI003B43231B